MFLQGWCNNRLTDGTIGAMLLPGVTVHALFGDTSRVLVLGFSDEGEALVVQGSRLVEARQISGFDRLDVTVDPVGFLPASSFTVSWTERDGVRTGTVVGWRINPDGTGSPLTIDDQGTVFTPPDLCTVSVSDTPTPTVAAAAAIG